MVQTLPVIPWNEFIPSDHKPHPKQLAFLLLPHEEAFYGGAAGGGKSDVLLMAALQYIDVPYYSALIIRKTLTDLKQASALLNRTFEWLDPWLTAGHVKYIPSEHTFLWPWKARLQFGYLGDMGSEEKFQSAEYQFIGIDEALQLHPDYYQYMFSRIRKKACQFHGGRLDKAGNPDPLLDDPQCSVCQRFGPLSRVPLRFRSAGNPGGAAHAWFMKRYKIEKNKATGRWQGNNPEIPFMPSYVEDNPSINKEEYGRMLDKLDYVTRMQLRFGDWGSHEKARFKTAWRREYTRRGDLFDLNRLPLTAPGVQHSTYDIRYDLTVFLVIDPAASVAEGISDARFHKGRNPSWTVVGVWAVSPYGDLILIDIIRFQDETPRILQEVTRATKTYQPQFVVCETNGPGLPIAQLLSARGIPIRPLFQSHDKIMNAQTAQVRMEQGKVFFPREAPWLQELENEIFIWTGHPHETNDQVDVFSNAARQVTLIAGEDQFDPQTGSPSGAFAVPTSVISPLYENSDNSALDQLQLSSQYFNDELPYYVPPF